MIGTVAPRRADAQRLLGRLRRGALRGDLVLRHIAAIGMAVRHHLVRDLGMAIGAGELEHGIAIPVDAQPFQAREDRVDRRLRRARAVGILDTEQEFAAVMAGIQPVEQRRPCAAEVQVASRRRRKARDDRRARGRRSGWRRDGVVIRCCAQPRLLPMFET
jgi:hypothetical protein